MVDFLLGVPGKLKTLLDRLTATRAGYLDASISSRASASALTTVDSEVGAILADTADMQPKLATMYTERGVKSVQLKEINDTAISSGTGNYLKYIDIPISSVTAANCLVLIQASATNTTGRQLLNAAGSTDSAYGVYYKFSTATNLRLGQQHSFITHMSAMITIVEFY